MSRQRWGQNFLVNAGVVQRIVQQAAARPEDLVIEVGPGRGVLTRALLETGCRLLALEIDPKLVEHLERSFAGTERIRIRHFDAVRADWSELAAGLEEGNALFVANLPYESATAILLHWLEASVAVPSLSRAIVMVQLEVGERLGAGPGSKAYGSLGALAQATHSVRKVIDVEPGSFSPPPKVRSRVVELTRLGEPLLDAQGWGEGSRFLHAAFAKRRKQLAGGLAGHGGVDRETWQHLLQERGHARTARAEELRPEELLALARAGRQL
jgi:16S rRNA (adenine1518-N6/adenine1519-N6)-dimethyltransferase